MTSEQISSGPPLARVERGGWRDEIGGAVRLALPLVVMQLGTIGINTTDVVMIGWFGPAALAAGALGMNLFIVFWLFSLGVLSATAPLAAQAHGARDPRGVRRTVRQGLWAAVALGLPCSLVLWQGELILLLLDQEPANAAGAGDYIRAALGGFVPSLGFVVLRSFVSALGRPGPATAVMLVGVALNILFNYALIFGNFGFPRLELVGAGLSSTLVQFVMFLALLGYVLLHRRLRRYHILLRLWRPDWDRFRRLFRIGLPIGGTLLCESGMFSLSSIMMGWIGTNTLAAHTIALQCAAVAFMIPLGVGQAGTVRVGLAAGRRDVPGIGRAGWSAYLFGILCSCATAVLFLTEGPWLVSLFLESGTPEVEAVARQAAGFLLVAALFQLFDGMQVIGGHVLRGLNDTRVPMLLAALGYWGIGLTSAWLLAFPLALGGLGVWIGLALGLAATALLAIWRFHRRAAYGLLRAFQPEAA